MKTPKDSAHHTRYLTFVQVLKSRRIGDTNSNQMSIEDKMAMKQMFEYYCELKNEVDPTKSPRVIKDLDVSPIKPDISAKTGSIEGDRYFNIASIM